MNNIGVNLDALIKRGYMCLEDKEWDKADTFFEQSLNLDAERAEAYLGKLMADLKVSGKEELATVQVSFENNNNYIKAERFGDEALKNELNGYIKTIKERNENARLEDIYSQAQHQMSLAAASANPVLFYKNTADVFAGISGYKDADALKEKCLELSEIALKDNILNGIQNEYMKADPERLDNMIISLEQLDGYKNADELIEACKTRIAYIEDSSRSNIIDNAARELPKANIKRIEELIEILTPLSEDARARELIIAYRRRIDEIKKENEQKKIKKQKTLKLIKKLSIIAVIVVVIAVAAILLLKLWILPQSDYNKALSLMEGGKYEDAQNIFISLQDYKDSESKVNECEDKIIESEYNKALSLMEEGEYYEANKIFNKIRDYKDSIAMSRECKYQQALLCVDTKDIDKAVELLDDQLNYKDSVDIIKNITVKVENSGDIYKAAVALGKLADKNKEFWELSRDLWGQITRRQTISAGWNYTVAVKIDGTVYATKVDLSSEYQYGQTGVSGWRDIIAVDAGWDHTVGLRSDGTVVAVGNNEDGQCNVESWTYIVAVNASASETYGLRADGTMISTRSNTYSSSDAMIMDSDYGIAELDYDGTIDEYMYGSTGSISWTDMIDIAKNDMLAGLCSDGTVKLYYGESYDNKIPDVSDWTDVVDIDMSMYYLVGLKSDGTVLVENKHDDYSFSSGLCSDWENVVQISSNASHIVGLTADGKVLSTGSGDYSDVDHWKNILVNE